MLDEFHVWPHEVPRSWWRAFRDSATALQNDDRALPAASLSLSDAQAFCRWFSDRYGVLARLPTVDEWEAAARAGKAGIPYPWGWGKPRGRAVWDAASASPVYAGEPNPWGLFNLSGNVAEWCEPLAGSSEQAPVMGGSWAERDQAYLRISHRLLLPVDYRDRDVGFRMVIEVPVKKETVALTATIHE